MKAENTLNIANNRIKWIDYAKAIGIILVIIGHAISKYNLNLSVLEKFIYSMHMPLFFIISGYLFKWDSSINKKEFIKKKVKRLILPYLLFIVLITVCHLFEVLLLHKGMEFFYKFLSIDNIFYTILCTVKSIYSNLWFFPCLLVSEIILFLLFRKLKNEYLTISVSLIIGFAFLFFRKFTNIVLPFCMETALASLLFLGVGSIVRKIEINNFCNIRLLINISLFIILNVLYSGKTFVYYNLDIESPGIFIFTAIFGSMIVIDICQKINNINILQSIGSNSMYIYGLHFIMQNIINIIIKIVANNINDYLILFVTTIINLLLCMCTINILKKWRLKNENFNC